MKITVEIGEKDYSFEMNRAVFKRLLADEQYAKMQNEVLEQSKEDNNSSETLLRNLIMQEQIFYYALLTNHPKMTQTAASNLLDKAYDEYGLEEVNNLISTLIENFTQRENQPRKKMVMKFN